MPIYDYSETGEIMQATRQRIVHGGYGDLIIGVADSQDSLLISLSKKIHDIGALAAREDGEIPLVVLAFDSVESLDAWISFAFLLRMRMTGESDVPFNMPSAFTDAKESADALAKANGEESTNA